MKTLLLIISLVTTQAFAVSITKNNGETIKLEDLKGKAVLVVNIATQCGYTPQLDNLEKVHQKYKDKGLVVIGIPSNDFGGQTPESDKEVAKFCKINYGASYTLSKKSVVKGDGKHPLIANLIKQDGEGEIRWNFEKFLIGKDGKLVKRFRSGVKPDSDEVTSKIEKQLK